MRITYRHDDNRTYWADRWQASGLDSSSLNPNAYPLLPALKALQLKATKTSYVLEAGCGAGRLVRYFHEKGVRIVGIDFISAVIAKINETYPALCVQQADILDLPFNNETFSHVLAFGLYHNLDESRISNALIETRRVMQTQGVLCASFRADNLQNLIIDKFLSKRIGGTTPLRAVGKAEGVRPKFHKINLTKAELRFIFENSGFEVKAIEETVNMPLLYKLRLFRHKTQANFDEVLSRSEGYRLNLLGRVITSFLNLFPGSFCSVLVVYAIKRV